MMGALEMVMQVTLFGRQWLTEGGHDDFVVTEPERFGEMIGPFPCTIWRCLSRTGTGSHQVFMELTHT